MEDDEWCGLCRVSYWLLRVVLVESFFPSSSPLNESSCLLDMKDRIHNKTSEEPSPLSAQPCLIVPFFVHCLKSFDAHVETLEQLLSQSAPFPPKEEQKHIVVSNVFVCPKAKYPVLCMFSLFPLSFLI